MAKFCEKCGTELKKDDTFCSNCGTSTTEKAEETKATTTNTTNTDAQPKSKMAAGLLGIFLGSLGIHNFYLGYTNKAIAQLLLSLIGWIACGLGPVAAAIWGLVEGIQILTGSISEDAQGNSLVD